MSPDAALNLLCCGVAFLALWGALRHWRSNERGSALACIVFACAGLGAVQYLLAV